MKQNQTLTVQQDVSNALIEDLNGLTVNEGDITANLISPESQVEATIITREDCVLCGVAWAEEAFRQVNESINVVWSKQDKDNCKANDVLCHITGSAKSILTAERTALNFLQLLSGTATTTKYYVDKLAGTNITLLDTRKTLPGLRLAQKYAVTCGGGQNHRVGLYDAFLIKENHVMACGSIAAAVTKAQKLSPGKSIEVEVENLNELQQAIDAGADIVMLDNFSIDMLHKAVQINTFNSKKAVKLEVSGNITHEKLTNLRNTGIDFVSSGALTKDVKSIDLSLRII